MGRAAGGFDAEFFSQFAPDRLFGALMSLDTAARRTVKHDSGLRISEFGDEECTLAPDYAESSLLRNDFTTGD
jgi:hypothetical protein